MFTVRGIARRGMMNRKVCLAPQTNGTNQELLFSDSNRCYAMLAKNAKFF